MPENTIRVLVLLNTSAVVLSQFLFDGNYH